MTQKRRIQDIKIAKKDAPKTERSTSSVKRSNKPKKVASDVTTRPRKRQAAPKDVSKPTKPSPTKNRSVKKKPSSKTKLTTRPNFNKRSRNASTPSVGSVGASTGDNSTLWGVAIILVVVLAVTIISLNARARVFVQPRVAATEVDIILDAYEEPVGGQLGYDRVSIPVQSRSSQTGVELVAKEVKASGTIRIFNNHSTSAQRLIEETRFESADGMIYKLAKGDEVQVPGFTIVDGERVPGSVEAVVYADMPGESYNKETADFVIPGFRSGPKFENFFARTVTPISGGFVGQVPAGQEDLSVPTDTDTLRSQAIRQIVNQVPQEFIAYEDLITLQNQDVSTSVDPNGSVLLDTTAEAVGVLLHKKDFSMAIAGKVLSLNQNSSVVITNLADLQVQLVPTDDESEKIQIMVSGTAQFRWQIRDDLVESLAEERKDVVRQILADESAIQEYRIKIRPFWKRSLPASDDVWVEVVSE
jgi:citrate lyase gamma subunit